MAGHSGESFSQMLRRVENRSAGRAAEGAMAMPGSRKFGRKDDEDHAFTPALREQMAPAFTKGKKLRGKKPRKAFTPASRALAGGGR